MTNDTPTGQPATGFTDKAAESADATIQAAREKAHDAFNGLSSTVHGVKDQAAATLERLRPQLDSMTAYAKDEPTKALLIAAAAGAGIMGLVTLLARSGGSSRMPSAHSLQKSVHETADAWRQAVAEQANRWRRAGADATDSAANQAEGAANSTANAARAAYEDLADTVMSGWKNQAAPIVERIRPQIDAVTSYAKDDPAKALLIAAAAGAALMGLMSSMSR